MKNILFSIMLIQFYVYSVLIADEQEFAVGNIKVKCLVFTPKLKDKTLPELFVFIGPGSGVAGVAPVAFNEAKDFCEKQGLFLVTPISDDSNGFTDGKNKIVIDLINTLIKDGIVSPKNILIGGISRGGNAALQIAANGDLSLIGVVAVPGVLREAPQNAKGYKNLHIFLRIGAKEEFAQQFLDKTLAELKKEGAIVDGKLVENGKHLFKINWEEIVTWKETLKNKQ